MYFFFSQADTVTTGIMKQSDKDPTKSWLEQNPLFSAGEKVLLKECEALLWRLMGPEFSLWRTQQKNYRNCRRFQFNNKENCSRISSQTQSDVSCVMLRWHCQSCPKGVASDSSWMTDMDVDYVLEEIQDLMFVRIIQINSQMGHVTKDTASIFTVSSLCLLLRVLNATKYNTSICWFNMLRDVLSIPHITHLRRTMSKKSWVLYLEIGVFQIAYFFFKISNILSA